MPETAPCPWCEDGGKPFPHRNHHPFFSYTVMCHTCHACGPHVKFDTTDHRKSWAEITEPVIAEAIERWNNQLLNLRIAEREALEIFGGNNEESGENRQGHEPADTALAAVS